MPKDNIEKAINKAIGAGDTEQLEEIMYEGYGSGGVAIMVYCLTDNKNRTAAFVRSTFDKNGGNLGTPGCVSYMFSRKGVIFIEKTDSLDEDTVMMEALEAGAEDMIVNQDNFEVRTEATDYHAVLEALKAAGYEIAESEVEFIPSMESKVDDESAIKALHKLIDTLDDNDDVQRVSYNCDLPDME